MKIRLLLYLFTVFLMSAPIVNGQPVNTYFTNSGDSITGGWIHESPFPGVDQFGYAELYALAFNEANGDVYIGGRFNLAGDIPNAHNIVRYNIDANTWHALGEGIEGRVHAITIDEDNVYAGGSFTLAGGREVNNIARWDGQHWHALGEGTDGNITDISVYNNSVFAVGQFTQAGGIPVNHVAMWDGTEWKAMGEGLPSGGHAGAFHIRSIDASDIGIFAAGGFRNAGPNSVSYIGKWDGEEWIQPDAEPDGTVHSITSFNGDIYIGGAFTQIGDLPVNHTAKWDGLEWSALGEGPESTVFQISFYDGELYAGSNFQIHHWDGQNWQPFGDSFTWLLEDFIIYDDRILLANDYDPHSAHGNINKLMQWSEARWDRVPTSGLNSAPGALTIKDNQVYAGSSLSRPGGSMTDVSVWDGSDWQTVGGSFNSAVIALATDGELIYAGGYFTEVGGEPVNNIALWDGMEWRPLGEGLNGAVHVITIHDGSVYAGGYFDEAGGIAANKLARWDGQLWHSIGQGWNETLTRIHAITFHEGDLYAGGEIIGDIQPVIARWDGQNWDTLEEGITSGVYAITAKGEDILVGGRFDEAGGNPASGLARWSTTQRSWHAVGDPLEENLPWWTSLPTPPTPTVHSIITEGDDIYVAGDFIHAGDVMANGIARWDGDQWHALGAGVNNVVQTMLLHDDRLYIGGRFTTAGEKVSPYFSIYDLKITTSVAEDIEGSVTANHITLAQNYPNPFNPSTTIRFELPAATDVSITVYNTLGQQVARLTEGRMSEGVHEVRFDASELASGIYLYRLEAGEVTMQRLMTLIK